MQDLKQKIQHTALFTPEEKVEILANIDTFSPSDIQGLTSIVDEYDAKHAQIVTTFKENMLSELDAIGKNASPDRAQKMQAAVEQIRSGIAAITSPIGSAS
jgi:hypothetical protein